MQATVNALRVYGVPLSVHTRKVLLTLRIKAVPYTPNLVVPLVPEETPSNWRDLSPTGLIPAIEDDGYVLPDSTAIVLYLERKFPTPSVVPRDPQGYGTALFLDSWAGSELFRRVVHPLFHELIVGPKLRGRPTDSSVVSQALKVAAPEALTYLERRAPQRFLVGDALSIADLAVVSNLVQLHYLGFPIEPARYPRLAAYFGWHLRAPLLTAAFEDERPFAENLGLHREFLQPNIQARTLAAASI